MSEKSIIIAIDGYSSTGKSSFAKRIASRYGLLYLDSGALYRAVTLFAMDNCLIVGGVLDSAALVGFLGDLNIHFRHENGRSATFIGGRNVEDDIRSMAVSGNVSIVSAEPRVRGYVDNILRSYGARGGVIMDGRDIGTTVFPEAQLKIFMTADPAVRARRRADELAAKGMPSNLDEVLKNLRERDYIDSHRDVSPLKKAPDAIVLDNSEMTLDEQMDWIGDLLREKFNILPVTQE